MKTNTNLKFEVALKSLRETTECMTLSDHVTHQYLLALAEEIQEIKDTLLIDMTSFSCLSELQNINDFLLLKNLI